MITETSLRENLEQIPASGEQTDDQIVEILRGAGLFGPDGAVGNFLHGLARESTFVDAIRLLNNLTQPEVKWKPEQLRSLSQESRRRLKKVFWNVYSRD